MITSCRMCGCTEECPCRLETGEDCILDVRSGVCNGPRCQGAVGRDRKLHLVQRSQDVVAAVRPIAERWRKCWAEQRAGRKPKKQKRRAA